MGKRSLYSAADQGNVDEVKALLASGHCEQLLKYTEGGRSCLHIAALRGHTGIVKLLADADAQRTAEAGAIASC